MQRTVGLVAAAAIGGLTAIGCVAHVYPEEEYPVYPYPEAEVYVDGHYYHGYRHEEHERRERHARHETERRERHQHR